MSRTTAAPPAPRGAHSRVGWRLAVAQIRRDRLTLAAAAILAIVAVGAVLAPVLALPDPLAQELSRRLAPPSWEAGGTWEHPLGTDQLGRDLLSRLAWGGRVSLVVGLSAVAISGLLGLAIGVTSGYFGGLLDDLLMRLADAQLAIPFILLVVAVVSVVGPGIQNVIIVIGATGWVVYARIVRSQVLSLREQEFVQAARAVGARADRIILRHIVPNVLGSVAVVASFEVANVILLESALGFLGLGVQPPTPSWGNMLGEGRDYLMTSWWLASWPGLALAVTALAVNVIGDSVRDLLDPRLVDRG